jgi:putative hydrolase of the HAD superfamily
MQIRTILLDFDGTIVDTEIALFQSWSKVYNYYNFNLDFEKFLSFWGNTIHKKAHEYLCFLRGRDIDVAETKKCHIEFHQEITKKIQMRPGIEELLLEAKLDNISISIVSSSSFDWVATHLKRLDIFNQFKYVITRVNVDRLKPEPDLYNLAKNMHSSDDILFALEDSPIGITSSKQAGLFTIAYPNEITKNFNLDQANIVLYDIKDILKIIN